MERSFSSPGGARDEEQEVAAASSGQAPGQRILALQRSAGNAAVSALLQRNGPETAAPPAGPPTAPTGPVNRSQLSGSLEAPPSGGRPAEAKPEGNDVVLSSDNVTLTGHAAAQDMPGLPDDEKAISPEVRVGFIQSVTSAGRVGHYTKDGKPGGPPYADRRVDVEAGTRDVRGAKWGSPDAPTEQRGTPPFYDFYKLLPVWGQSQDLTTEDRLKQRFPLTMDGNKGLLAATSGSDNFRMSVAAHQPPNAPIHLDAKEWGQDWSMQLDPTTHEAAGTKATFSEFKGQLDSLGEPTGAANWDAKTWTAVRSVEAVQQLSSSELMMLLAMARQKDNHAYELMATELRVRNPKLGMTIKVRDDDDLLGDTAVQVAVQGVRGPQTRGAKIGSGPFATDSAELSFALLDFYDPNDIQQGTSLTITVTAKGHAPGTVSWNYPFSAKTRHVSSGKAFYELTLHNFGT